MATKKLQVLGGFSGIYNQGVYDAGYAHGETAGYSEGYADGQGPLEGFKRSFWSALVDNWRPIGKFSHWDETMFNAMLPYPAEVYDGSEYGETLYVENGTRMFWACKYPGSFYDLGLPNFIAEQLSIADTMFASSHFTELPEFTFITDYDAPSMFASSKCRKIRGLHFADGLWYEGNQFYGKGLGLNAFYNCADLEDIESITGYIVEPLKLQWSPNLTVATLRRIINALVDLTRCSRESFPDTLVLTIGNTNLAKLTDEEKAIATQKGWTLA